MNEMIGKGAIEHEMESTIFLMQKSTTKTDNNDDHGNWCGNTITSIVLRTHVNL